MYDLLSMQGGMVDMEEEDPLVKMAEQLLREMDQQDEQEDRELDKVIVARLDAS